MKKIKKILIIFILCVLLSACTNDNNYKVEIYVNDEVELVEAYKLTNAYDLLVDPEIDSYEFEGWYLDETYNTPLPKDYKIKKNTKIYAKIIKKQYVLTFYNDDELYQTINVEKGNRLESVPTINKDGYDFIGWSTKRENGQIYNFDRIITDSLTFYAQFQAKKFKVNYVLNYDTFSTKDSLYEAYFTDYYNFLITETKCNMESFGITNVDEFLVYCKTWKANGKNEMAGLGDAFGSYYLKIDVGGTLDNQPTTHFIGYCYQNNKYVDLINHLIVFFAYWRTDEGYTGSSSDPNNLGNDFFASAWASFVDTCKFFYFTGDTLNDTYGWFRSQRVKEALDNVPGVFETSLVTIGDINNPVELIDISRDGYTFLGWYDENGNKVTVATTAMTVYAKWEKN